MNAHVSPKCNDFYFDFHMLPLTGWLVELLMLVFRIRTHEHLKSIWEWWRKLVHLNLNLYIHYQMSVQLIQSSMHDQWPSRQWSIPSTTVHEIFEGEICLMWSFPRDFLLPLNYSWFILFNFHYPGIMNCGMLSSSHHSDFGPAINIYKFWIIWFWNWIKHKKPLNITIIIVCV